MNTYVCDPTKPPLPHVCPCGALRVAGEWTMPETLPPGPHSHGACPACVAKYRAENEQLRRVATAARAGRAKVPTGGFRI